MKTEKTVFPLMQKAVACHQDGRFEEAESIYLNVLALVPGHSDALRFLGALYVQQNQPERAVETSQEALKASPDHPELLNNLGVALSRIGKAEEAMTSYKAALRVKPDYQDALANLGHILYDQGRLEEALPYFEDFLGLSPDHPVVRRRAVQVLEKQELWDRMLAYYIKGHDLERDDIGPLTRLGNYLRGAGRSEEASTIYHYLIELAPEDVYLRLNAGIIFHDLGKADEALAEFERALVLQPTSIDALVSRGSLFSVMNRAEEARASYDQALTLNPQSLDAQWGKALVCLSLGDYREGWPLFETGLARPHTRGPSPYPTAIWDGRDFPDKRLLIWAEQGIGDVLQFIRYAALCKQRGGTVLVQAPEPLRRLLENCPYIDRVVLSATENDFDEHVPVMSLPQIFGTRLETIPSTFPYLFTTNEVRQKWAPRFVGRAGLKVGLVWSGNPRRQQIEAHVVDRRRSMSLDLMKPFLDLDHVEFFSLQKGEAASEIDTNGLRHKITDYMPEVEDFLDTAAIIENLDLVISVDTSVVHLAGGLGNPVWILSRFDGCWRWLRNRETSPWYPSARIFSQPTLGDWTSVVDKVTSLLRTYHSG